MPSDYANDIADIKGNVATLLERSANANELLRKLNGTVDAIDKQVDQNRDDITALETKLGIFGGLQATFTTLAAVLAGWWGATR